MSVAACKTLSVPDGVCGDWRIESFTVSDQESRWTALRPREYVAPGTYKRLMRGRTVVMSNTPMEIRTNWSIVHRATGSVLINGLGLGMVLAAILEKPEVEAVTVVEIAEEVITLVGPTYQSDPRVEIIHADAMAYRPAKGQRFNAVWHDIWDYICADNLTQMRTLHRRYGRRADWQGSWCRYECEAAQ